MENFPNWLKSSQNGSIGESRTRSFLLNRFWLLERSVDIHGADFLIQQRIYDKNILDDEPIRFGVVQSKFSQNELTTHKIKKEYILDRDNTPRIEFFLLIHTGDEEQPEMYLLTSKDISEDFIPNEKGEYVISSKKVFMSSKYKVEDKKKCLDRMENSIQCAEFYKNRLYAFHKITSTIPDFEAIQPEYREDIEHWFGTIPEEFKNQKKKVYDVLLTIEKAHEYLVSFLESVDPIETSLIIEKWEYDLGSSIDLPEIYDPSFSDFYYAAKGHKEMVENMRNDGALDNYFMAKKSIYNETNAFYLEITKNQISKDHIQKMTIEYDPNNLRLNNIENRLTVQTSDSPQQDYLKFIEAKEGKIHLSWKIGKQYKPNKPLLMNEIFLRDIMEKMYSLKYYEGHEV